MTSSSKRQGRLRQMRVVPVRPRGTPRDAPPDLPVRDPAEASQAASAFPAEPVTFASLDLPPGIQQALDEVGYTHATQVQAVAIPKARAGLDLIGLTFAMFGLPILVFSPYAGRLADRRGVLWFIVFGSILPFVTGLTYTIISDPLLAVPLILIEATGFAFLNPALYAVVAANSPPGRSSTAQGLFGAAGTLGFIVASVTTGVLAEQSILLPFYTFSSIMLVTLALGAIVGGTRLRGQPLERPAVPAPAEPI